MFDKIKPHLIAILSFVILSAVLFPDAFQGKTVTQPDMIRYRGLDNKTKEHYEKTGELALWNNSTFSGMPAFFAGHTFASNKLKQVYLLSKLYLPGPIGYFFGGMLCAYLLFMALGVRHWLAAIGAIATVLASYNFIIYEVGHVNKLMTIIYFPLVAAGLIHTFKKRWLLGGALYSLGLGLAIFSSHLQMVYYLAISLGVLFIAYTVYQIKQKKASSLLKTIGVLVAFSILAVGANTSRLLSSYNYMKHTMRGPAILKAEDTSVNSSTGLDKDYVFRWSHGVEEVFTYMIPGFLGGSSSEPVSLESAFASDLLARGASEEQVKRAPLYWGNMPYTAGPTYFGAIIMFLFIFGLLSIKGYLKWWVLAVSILFTFLSFGSNMSWFNDLFYYYAPLYNKFRSVNSSLAVLQFTFPILAILGLNQLLNNKNGNDKSGLEELESNESLLKKTNKQLYISLAATGGLCLLFALLGPSLFDLGAAGDAQMAKSGYNIDTIIETRGSLLRTDSFRSFFFIALVFGLLWAYINKKLKLKKMYVFIIIGLLITLDMGLVGNRYLNSEKFVDEEEYFAQFTNPRAVDIPILQDTDPNFRVFDASIDVFNSNQASRYHNTIGGYNAAKLRRYQDMIDKYIGQGDMNILNMLNTKYFIQKNQQGQAAAQQNPAAMGNCWFVDTVSIVKTANEEINALSNFNPRTKAFVHEEFKNEVQGLSTTKDSTSIVQSSYGLNKLEYKSNSSTKKLAIFSEVWYMSGKNGWQAYIDNKPVEHIRANYILRALPIPAGQHTIRFEFQPADYFMGEKISLFASILLILITLGAVGLYAKKEWM